jgi:hypothetical protein
MTFGVFGEFVITEVSKQTHWVICGFSCDVNEIYTLLGFYAPKIGSSETMFRNNIPVLFSRVKKILGPHHPKILRWVKFEKKADHKLQHSRESYKLFSL